MNPTDDPRLRLHSAKVIRDMCHIGDTPRYVLVVEHDLSVLDYLSDSVCCLYGTPGAYGVVTMPYSVREGDYTPPPPVASTPRPAVAAPYAWPPVPQASTFSWLVSFRRRTCASAVKS